jgi:hypothetical protein
LSFQVSSVHLLVICGTLALTVLTLAAPCSDPEAMKGRPGHPAPQFGFAEE